MRAIVFVLRGCPAGWLGAYGNEWVVTPNLDRLAVEGVVFDRHVSDCPDPAAAGRAWLSGRHQLPPIDGDPHQALTPDSRLTDDLRAASVRTVLVRANRPETDGPAPFYAGWEEVFDARPRADDPSPLDALVRAFPSILDRLGSVPRWLLWVEIDRLLPPWDVSQAVFEEYAGDVAEGADDEPDEVESDEEVPAPPVPATPLSDPPTGPFDGTDPAAWDRLRNSFAAVVTALDAELGRLFDELRPRGLDQTATWLVTSDLGYPLGEHGQIGRHRPWLHEELVHLPLLVRLPGAIEAGRRVPAFTLPADLAPTLLDLFGATLPADVFHGRGLLPLARGKVESVREYACSGLVLNGAAEWAVRTADRVYLLPVRPHPDDPPREPMLFEQPDDRWEVNDLRARNTERAEQLDDVLRKFVAAVQRSGQLSNLHHHLPEV